MTPQHEPTHPELQAASANVNPRYPSAVIHIRTDEQQRICGGKRHMKIDGHRYIYMRSTQSLVRLDAWQWIKETRKVIKEPSP